MAMTGMLASSKAGHDKDMIYVIIKEEAEYVYLADGDVRTIDKPKKKNKKHIQIIKKYLEADASEHIRAGHLDDIEIKKAIKQYQVSRKQEVSNVKS